MTTTRWPIIAWQAGSLMLTGAYLGFLFTLLTLFGILAPSIDFAPLSRWTSESFIFWLLATGLSWALTSFWAFRKFDTQGMNAAVLASLCHLGWMLFSFFVIFMALFVPSFSVAYVLISPK